MILLFVTESNREDGAAVLDSCNHVHAVDVVCHASAVHVRCALDCAAGTQTRRLPAPPPAAGSQSPE